GLSVQAWLFRSLSGGSIVIPGGFADFADASIGSEEEVSVEVACEPTIMSDGEDGSRKRPQGSLEGLGRDEVEVVCRLVHEMRRRPAELQQQNLESRLLTA